MASFDLNNLQQNEREMAEALLAGNRAEGLDILIYCALRTYQE